MLTSSAHNSCSLILTKVMIGMAAMAMCGCETSRSAHSHWTETDGSVQFNARHSGSFPAFGGMHMEMFAMFEENAAGSRTRRQIILTSSDKPIQPKGEYLKVSQLYTIRVPKELIEILPDESLHIKVDGFRDEVVVMPTH